ncbi:MAG: hypothetical protein AB7O32_11305 [Vicinamibacterales bacterium]
MQKFCAALVAGLLLALPLEATVLVSADLPTLVREAGVIVRGRVARTETRWRGDRRGVETLVTLDVDAHLKGAPAGSVTFVVPGGRMGRFRNVVVGAPQFVEAQQVIVFLGHRGPSLPFVLGLTQGLFRLQRADASWVVVPPAAAETGTHATPVVRGDPARRPIALDAFERRVRALVEVR